MTKYIRVLPLPGLSFLVLPTHEEHVDERERDWTNHVRYVAALRNSKKTVSYEPQSIFF